MPTTYTYVVHSIVSMNLRQPEKYKTCVPFKWIQTYM